MFACAEINSSYSSDVDHGGAMGEQGREGIGSDIPVCFHLRPIFTRLVPRHSRITGSSVGAWNQVDLEIVLDRGPHPDSLAAAIPLVPPIEFWANYDTHYPIEFGLRCVQCKQSLSWPQADLFDLDSLER